MEELASRMKNGSTKAFEEFVEDYEKNVFNIAIRILKNTHDAQDATQEVFLRVYRNIRRFEGRSSLSTWVYQITMNVCIDMTRQKKKLAVTSLTPKDENEDTLMVDIMDESYQPELHYEQKELKKLVRTAIDRLPQEQRELLVLREFTELSYAELAEILQINEGTVKSRLFRARERLANILIGNGNKSEIKTSDVLKGR